LKSKNIHNPWKSSFSPNCDFSDLEELSEEIIDNRGKTVPVVEKGIPLIATNCVNNEQLFPIFHKVRYVTKEIFKNWFRGHPKPKDILFVNKGSHAGKVCFVPDPVNFCIAQDMISIRPNQKKIVPEYMLAVMRSQIFQKQLKSFHVGTLIPHIKKTSFKEIIVPIPSEPIQKIIGQMYYNFSKQIDNLEKENKILKKITETIFKSWFIDYDNEKEFDNSKFGKIPKNWKIRKLKEFIHVEKGLSYKGKYLTDLGTPLVNLGNFGFYGNFNFKKLKYYSGEFKNKNIVKAGDIVIANTDITQERVILGKAIIIPPLKSDKIIFTHHVFAIRFDQPLGKYFLYNILSTVDYKDHVISYAQGTTVLAILNDAVEDFEFLHPGNDVIEKFEKSVTGIYKKIDNNILSIINLKNTRDYLLEKIISGDKIL